MKHFALRAVVLCFLVVTPCGALGVALSACSSKSTNQDSSAEEGRVTSLCDGAAELKLRVFAEPQNAQEFAGSLVRVENGFPSLAIDGTCSYWLGGGWTSDSDGKDSEWRTGKLDPGVAWELAQALPVDHLDRLQDCVAEGGLFDASARTFRSRTSRASCIRGGRAFEAAWNIIQERTKSLWDAGTPLAGPIRISATSRINMDVPYDWPLTQALLPLVIPEDVASGAYIGQASGISHLISDSDGASLLRAIRNQYLIDKMAAPGLHMGGLLMRLGNTTAAVFLRDALPYEDEHGLLPFSDPPLVPP